MKLKFNKTAREIIENRIKYLEHLNRQIEDKDRNLVIQQLNFLLENN